MSKLPNAPARLGTFILEENPYPWPIQLPPDFDVEGSPHVEKLGLGAPARQNHPFKEPDLDPKDPRYGQGFFWDLGGVEPSRMSKAIRISYEYALPNGKTKTYAIVIGYEGGGGGM
jgi:hypothetical protein